VAEPETFDGRSIPEQRDRFSGAPESQVTRVPGMVPRPVAATPGTPGNPVDELDQLVLDDSFVHGATVKEASARTRMLEARWRNEPPHAQPFRGDLPSQSWKVKPARHLRSLRFDATLRATAVIMVAVGATVLLLAIFS
jgi:hypothetical protein